MNLQQLNNGHPANGSIREPEHVPADGDVARVSPTWDRASEDRIGRGGRVNDADHRHRIEFARFAREDSHQKYRPVLGHLYGIWEGWNIDYCDGKLVPPHFLLAKPKNPQAYGDHSLLSAWGSTHQTRIRPSILDGSHPAVHPGEEFAEGRLRLVEDIALHETVHQYQTEVLGRNEDSYRGHGPVFRDQCNRIGGIIGLGCVRTGKARGRDRDLPSCAEWPICVRPRGYYLGAYRPHQDADVEAEVEDVAGGQAPVPPKALADWLTENPEWAARFQRFGEGIFELFDLFFDQHPAPPAVQSQSVTFLAKCYRHRQRPKPKAALPALMPPPTH